MSKKRVFAVLDITEAVGPSDEHMIACMLTDVLTTDGLTVKAHVFGSLDGLVGAAKLGAAPFDGEDDAARRARDVARQITDRFEPAFQKLAE